MLLWGDVVSSLSSVLLFALLVLMSSLFLLSGNFPLRRCEKSKPIASDDAKEPDDCTLECADDFLSKRCE